MDIVDRLNRGTRGYDDVSATDRYLDCVMGEAAMEITRLRAALEASGYNRMREALQKMTIVVDYIHEHQNEGSCQWENGEEQLCRTNLGSAGACEQTGCLKAKIAAASAALGEDKT